MTQYRLQPQKTVINIKIISLDRL